MLETNFELGFGTYRDVPRKCSSVLLTAGLSEFHQGLGGPPLIFEHLHNATSVLHIRESLPECTGYSCEWSNYVDQPALPM